MSNATTSFDKFKTPWLIQRLCRPYAASKESLLSLLDFSFGGGLINGGFSKDGYQYIKENLFSFDYMGSSEFEWGAVPAAFSNLIKNYKDFVTFEIVLDSLKGEFLINKYRTPMRAYVDGKRKKLKDIPAPTEKKTIYVICHKNFRQDVKESILELAKNNLHLKEGAMLTNALDPINDFDKRTCGWIDLYNCFMFFTDSVMFGKTVEVFEATQV
jgi:hypothetical protein